MYETKEEFYEEAKNYQQWVNSKAIKAEISDKLKSLSYDELIGLSKLLNINILGE